MKNNNQLPLKKIKWNDYTTNNNKLSINQMNQTQHLQKLINCDSISLLDSMLVWDHKNRITCQNALKHPYFHCLKTHNQPKHSNIQTHQNAHP